MLLHLQDPQSVAFKIMTSYELVGGHQPFGATQYLHLHFYSEDGQSTYIYFPETLVPTYKTTECQSTECCTVNVGTENFNLLVKFTRSKNYQFMVSCDSKCMVFLQLIFVSMVSIWCVSICTKPIIPWHRCSTCSREPTRSLSTLSFLKNATCINQFLKYQTKYNCAM